jgi:predicted GIY-YIG superfamily endonuclease
MNYLLKLTASDIFKYPLQSRYGAYNDISCFYAIINILNGKIYIGQTKAFYMRMRSHIYNSRKNTGLHIDTSMYNNLQNFRFVILSTFEEHNINFFTRKKITIIEQNYIRTLKTQKPYGYNEYICSK